MDWQDEALVLTVRPHGETSAIVDLFTPAHGRHAGIVRGGLSRRMAAVLQPGTQVQARWQARLEDQLGRLTLEPLRSRAALWDDRTALAALAAVCQMVAALLPPSDPHPGLYAATLSLLDTAGPGERWARLYLAWERLLLDELGFGLDLSTCALTGSRVNLTFVSPKTGRAVSQAAVDRGLAGDWADRLLPLPAVLRPDAGAATPLPPADLAAGLTLTGHFLNRLAAEIGAAPLPAARARLVERLTAPSAEA